MIYSYRRKGFVEIKFQMPLEAYIKTKSNIQ